MGLLPGELPAIVCTLAPAVILILCRLSYVVSAILRGGAATKSHTVSYEISSCWSSRRLTYHQRQATKGAVLISMAAVFGLVYWWNTTLLDRVGTIAPWYGLYYSTAADISYSITPPPSFNRQSVRHRVVVTLTTMPSNINHLKETLVSLMYQTWKPDAIYLNVPAVNTRTGAAYTVPDWLTEIEFEAVTVNSMAQDYGPLTKLVGALLVENDPDTIVITVDDDKVYHPHLVQNLVWFSHNEPGKAFGPCGWSFMPMPYPRGVVPVYLPWMLRGNGRYIDVLQACCGNLYRRGFFGSDLKMLMDPPKECFTTDDLWIAANLAMHEVPRVLTGGDRLDPSTPLWKQTQEDKDIKNNLSEGNAKAGKDIGCIEAAERRFGKQWQRVKDYKSQS